MASTYSTSLRLELMATGDQSGTWGDTTNTNLGTLLEQAITGVLSVAQGDVANLTLTTVNGGSDQARNAVVNITGALTADRNVVVQTANKLYLLKNSTTGGFNIVAKTAAGTGVTIAAGTAQLVYSDGTNVVQGLSGTLAVQAPGNVAITGGSVTGLSTLSSTGSSVGYVGLTTTSTEAAAAAGPLIDVYRNSASPAANDVLGQVIFNGQNSTPAKKEYASVQAVITTATAASEASTLDTYVQVAGARALATSQGPALAVSTNGSNVTTAPGISFIGDPNTGIGHSGADTLDFVTNGVNIARIGSTGARTTVIPSGSTLYPAFDCRAWVNFNGTTINASGNVTSVTKNATGDYTITFTTAMADANYSGGFVAAFSTAVGGSIVGPFSAAPTTTTFRVATIRGDTGNLADNTYNTMEFFR